jgi:hypothetical protein
VVAGDIADQRARVGLGKQGVGEVVHGGSGAQATPAARSASSARSMSRSSL